MEAAHPGSEPGIFQRVNPLRNGPTNFLNGLDLNKNARSFSERLTDILFVQTNRSQTLSSCEEKCIQRD